MAHLHSDEGLFTIFFFAILFIAIYILLVFILSMPTGLFTFLRRTETTCRLVMQVYKLNTTETRQCLQKSRVKETAQCVDDKGGVSESYLQNMFNIKPHNLMLTCLQVLGHLVLSLFLSVLPFKPKYRHVVAD